MINPNLLTLDLVKLIISQVPSITLAPDMKGPVDIINGHQLEARSHKFISSQLNAEFFREKLGEQTIALYQFYNAGRGLKIGQTYQVLDYKTFDLGQPFVAKADIPDNYILRYAVIPNE